MAFVRQEQYAGGQGITEVSAVQNHPFGTRIIAYDPTYGRAEFVYVKGVASAAAGLLGVFNPYTGVTALTGARSKGLAGVFMAALVAGTYGWMCVKGACPIQTNGAVVAGTTVYLTATAGKVDDAVVAGDIVYGANFCTADGTPAANQAVVALADPYVGDTDNA